MRLTPVLLVVQLWACGPAASTGASSSFKQGMQANGAIGFAQSAITATSTTRKQQVEISAPILPDSKVWQYKGGSGYPATAADALKLVRDSTYTFEWLVASCASKYPIATAAPGSTLTAAQLLSNYDVVSRCGYMEYGAKPYWVPQIVSDVDVCAEKLGSGWHLLTEAELAGFTEADFTFIQMTMSLAKGSDWFPRQFYFSLDVYVRATDGSLKLGNLAPDTTHVTALPIAAAEMKDLYVGNGRPIGVRCTRITPLTE